MSEAAAISPPMIPGFSYVRPLGSGGFAQVYLYEQDMPRRLVAVKVLRARGGVYESPGQLRGAFEREVDSMGRLSSHPSIVSIYQASIAPDGSPFLTMEYCPDSMGVRTKGKPADMRVVLDAGVRVAAALEMTHQAGVIHRDVKPSNVLLTAFGRPVLADFGIAQTIQIAEAPDDDNDVAMSIPWSAPEVVGLHTQGGVPSDVWSLGATLYTFAAGHPPFESSDKTQNSRSKLIQRIVKSPYTPVPGAKGYAPLDEVLARTLEKREADRYPSMLELGRALQGVQRSYGYDVTPLEVVSAEWLPRAASADPGARAPLGRAALPRRTRADERAEMLAERHGQDSDGIMPDRARPSTLVAGLTGAGLMLAAIAAIAGVWWLTAGVG